MADVVVVGGGVVGLGTAMLLAEDGHQVTLLERDPAPPPDGSETAWDTWERRGVNQFRLPHISSAGIERSSMRNFPK
jgi:glycine/D-amino acid oxidase-like deaminating enzyme